MCLATVYEEAKKNENVICKNITKIEIDGENIKLVDIMGAETYFLGRIVSAELSGGTIILKKTEGAA